MIVFIIIMILVFKGLHDLACASDWEASEYNAEMRHLELLDTLDRNNSSLPATRHTEDRDIDYKMMRDEYGREVWEEHLHEHIERY